VQIAKQWRDVVVLPTVTYQPCGFVEHALVSIDKLTRYTSDGGTPSVQT